jgi:phage FluMu gp28-like protein
MIGLPKHPGTRNEIGILGYQQKYFDAIQKHHKVILNKSRKIGATETALRSIAYNCFGRYEGHNVMMVAGNRQSQAIEFLDRFCSLFDNGFFDLSGKKYSFSDIIPYRRRTEVRFWNETRVTTYPALPSSLRGPQNVICVYISEAAFIDSHDDSKVYDALHPNIANIEDADFIIESTPNGRRGFFHDLFTSENEYCKLEQPHSLALGKLISKTFIESERKNPKIDFEQEYCCKFTTSANAVFKSEDIKWGSGKFTDYRDLLGH